MKTSGKKYLVTGGAGFIGSHLCEKIVKEGHSVVCFDNLSTGFIKNIKHLLSNPRFTFINGDANKKKDLENTFEKNKFDGLFHYAAVVGVKRTLADPISVLRDIEGIKNILELSAKYHKPKIIFSSSSEVYGEPIELPEKEEGVINPRLPYAMVKLLGEKFMEVYGKEYKLKTCSLRFFNVYGPRQESSDYGFVVGIFIKQVLAGKSPTVFGDGNQTRDFTFIEDNIEASWRAMQSDKANGQVINIGSGRPITILNLANLIIESSGMKGKLIPQLNGIKRDDIKHRSPEITKMVKLLDFKTKISLEEGLKKTIKSYLSK